MIPSCTRSVLPDVLGLKIRRYGSVLRKFTAIWARRYKYQASSKCYLPLHEIQKRQKTATPLLKCKNGQSGLRDQRSDFISSPEFCLSGRYTEGVHPYMQQEGIQNNTLQVRAVKFWYMTGLDTKCTDVVTTRFVLHRTGGCDCRLAVGVALYP